MRVNRASVAKPVAPSGVAARSSGEFLRFSIVASALVAVMVGFGGTLAVIVQAAGHLGGTPDQISSWVAALCLGIGATSVFLSAWYRMPIVTAWSLAGAVLIASAPPGIGMNAAVGAFVACAVLTLFAGAVPALGQAIARLQPPIAGAMLAGLVLRFVLGMVQAAQASPALVLPLIGIFLVTRLVHAASAPLVVIAAGVPLAAALGLPMPLPDRLELSSLVLMPPVFSVPALVGLGLPLFLVTMATQQISGAAVLRVSGYVPPVRGALLVTGLASLVTAPFGGYSTNLSSVTAAICTGPDTHPDPAKRWMVGPIYGLLYLVLAAFGASLVTLFGSLPPALIATVAGTALLGPLTGSLAAAMSREHERLAAVLAFAVTASGVTLAGVGAAFWGLAAGLLALGLERLWRARR